MNPSYLGLLGHHGLTVARLAMITLFVTSIISSTACSTSGQPEVGSDTVVVVPSQHILIVYLTRTKNTKVLAQLIQNQVGGKLVGLELEKPYPTDYKAHVDQVVQENATGFLPPLKTTIDNFDQYKVVFVGFPTWGMQLPPPIKSFLKHYNLAGKTLIPFNTNAGYGIGSSFDEVRKLAPTSQILEGFSTQGGIERDGVLFVMEGEKVKQVSSQVRSWLQRLNVLK